MNASKYKNGVIDAALVTSPGDPSVGISPMMLEIRGTWLDLSVLPETEQESTVEAFRLKLREAFEVAWGEPVTVVFEGESPYGD